MFRWSKHNIWLKNCFLTAFFRAFRMTRQLVLHAENQNFYPCVWHGAKLSYVGGHFVQFGLRGKLGQPLHFRSELIHAALVQENVFSQMTYCKTPEHIWCCTHLLLLLLFLSLSPPSFLFLLSNCLEYECNAPERQTRVQLNDLWGFGGFGQLACSRTGLCVVCVWRCGDSKCMAFGNAILTFLLEYWERFPLLPKVS